MAACSGAGPLGERRRAEMDRRTLLKRLAAASVLGAAGTAATQSPARAGLLDVLKYRALVPEIFTPLADPPTYTQAVVIGTGFGGAVSALRLAQAGIGVTMLERGSRWPSDPHRGVFANDVAVDGRGFWHRTSFTGVSGIPQIFDDFGGVLDVTSYAGIQVWRGAAVGGGSVVYTAATVQPEQRFFDAVFTNRVSYDEMNSLWWPLVRSMLKSSLMPADVYASDPFKHSRSWDDQVRKAGYTPQPIQGNWNWDIVRAENAGRSRRSATIGETNLGNSNGSKQDLTQNYLKQAEATGKAVIYPGHQVTLIGKDGAGRWTVAVQKIDPTGKTLLTRTLTCDYLVLGAGSVGTSELLVKAKALGTLPALNGFVGQGWGTNGDAAVVRSIDLNLLGSLQASPSASRILDETGDLPVTFENWIVPGLPISIGLSASLGMTLDPVRSNFTYNRSTGKVDLNWKQSDSDRSRAAMEAVNAKLAKANGTTAGFAPLAPSANTSFTAHPLGGAVLGDATDNVGRVKGYSRLYVMDGAAIPGNTGTVNPSLTIAALAERNIAAVIKAGG
jgi:cholesterol oxidase